MEAPIKSKVPYPCKGTPNGGACPSLCCFQAADALKGIVDLKLSGQPVDPKIFDFPYTVDQITGRCENVMDDGGCKVYLDRPLLCNIEKAAEAVGLDPMIFMPANAEACNHHMTNAGIPKEQQIDVEKYRIDLINDWRNAKPHNPTAQYPLTPEECTPEVKE